MPSSRSMESYNARAPPPKLKDSCDFCAASKLRCDKQKPTCARCAGLDQPCSYSPARRSGRPHRARRGSSQLTEATRHNVDQNTSAGSGGGGNGGQIDHGSAASSRIPFPFWWQPSQQVQHHQSSSAADSSTGDDCTRTALLVLEQLNMARRNRDGVAHVSLTTTEACQRLLAILICPCSEQPGVALLVASGCISLMDTVHDLSQGQQAPRDAAISEACSSMTVWSMPSPSPRLLNGSTGGVEDLAKVAKVILQFADKYCQDSQAGPAFGWPSTRWLVAPIIPLLRYRLQSVTREAARRLVL